MGHTLSSNVGKPVVIYLRIQFYTRYQSEIKSTTLVNLFAPFRFCFHIGLVSATLKGVTFPYIDMHGLCGVSIESTSPSSWAYNSWAYIRNVIIGVYIAAIWARTDAPSCISVPRIHGRDRFSARPFSFPLPNEYARLPKAGNDCRQQKYLGLR